MGYAMRWCQGHWDGLKAEINRQGMSGLIPTDGNRMAENLQREIDGEQSTDTFDPLMGAMMGMNAFMMGPVGLGPMLFMMEGCPLCFVDDKHDELCKDGENCQQGLIAQFFVNAVGEQKQEWERRVND